MLSAREVMELERYGFQLCEVSIRDCVPGGGVDFGFRAPITCPRTMADQRRGRSNRFKGPS